MSHYCSSCGEELEEFECELDNVEECPACELAWLVTPNGLVPVIVSGR